MKRTHLYHLFNRGGYDEGVSEPSATRMPAKVAVAIGDDK